MQTLVLGSAAGGGFPQWNCNCRNCAGLRQGRLRGRSRTQSSIAVTANGQDWLLINASPDIRVQLAAHRELWPAAGARDNPVRAIVLVDAQLDHTLGLLTLREGKSLEVYSTDGVKSSLTGAFPVFDVLAPFCGVHWHPVPVNGDFFEVTGIEGLRLQAIPLEGNRPRYVTGVDNGEVHTMALVIADVKSGRTLLYAPAIKAVAGPLAEWLSRCDLALLDGTFWSDDELVVQGCGTKRASDMSHLPLAGPQGLIEKLKAFPKLRKVLVHINNTNPILDEESPERAILAEENIEVAHDGMQLGI